MNWKAHAQSLAAQVTDPHSRWRRPIEQTPRHVFLPRWWDGRTLRDGRSNDQAWMETAYSDRSIVTQRGPLHADKAKLDDRPKGDPTSSSTLPSLLVQMYRHGRLFDGARILDVGTGSGYGCALLATRFGDGRVTSIDVDAYLVEAAEERLASVGLHPLVKTVDATGPMPGEYDRLVSTVAVRPIPGSWLAALKTGGRLVTPIAGTTTILTAEKHLDGWARGRIEWDRAGFMRTRHGSDYPNRTEKLFLVIKDADGEEISEGRYPVICVDDAWELCSVLDITAPGITHYYELGADNLRTAWMVHEDGSWARAQAVGIDHPTVHQSGPRRLWDTLDQVRDTWLSQGYFQLYGAEADIPPTGGEIHLRRGAWRATIT